MAAPNGYMQKRAVLEGELQKLADQLGRPLTAHDVVQAAEPELHPLHKFFTWDNDQAAYAHRLSQARHLMNHIKIVTEERTLNVSTLTNLRVDRFNGGGYRFTSDVLATRNLREAMVAEALGDLQRIELKYRHLTELAEVWAAIDEANGQS